jgi:hypothetical protein
MKALVARQARFDRIFYTGAAVALMLIAYAGFAPTFYMRAGTLPPLSMLLTLHGGIFTLWVFFVILQTSLIAANRRTVHKRLGIAGGFLGAAMAVVGILAAVDALRRGATPLPGIDPRTFFIVPVADIVLFAGFLGLGFYYRRSLETHKRLMLVATISLLGAAFGRIIPRLGNELLIRGGPFSVFGMVVGLVFVAGVYDLATRRRVHPVYLWGGIAIAASVPLRLAIGSSGPWLAFADSLLR